jgi:hypothetical protein
VASEDADSKRSAFAAVFEKSYNTEGRNSKRETNKGGFVGRAVINNDNFVAGVATTKVLVDGLKGGGESLGFTICRDDDGEIGRRGHKPGILR